MDLLYSTPVLILRGVLYGQIGEQCLSFSPPRAPPKIWNKIRNVFLLEIIRIGKKDIYKQNRWQESIVVPPAAMPIQPIVISSVETRAKQTENENAALNPGDKLPAKSIQSGQLSYINAFHIHVETKKCLIDNVGYKIQLHLES